MRSAIWTRTALHECASPSAAVISASVGAPSASRMVRPPRRRPAPRKVGKRSSGVVTPASSARAMMIALKVDPGVNSCRSGAKPE